MGVELGQIFSPGLNISYEYDFGSTTHLKLKVVAERTGKIIGEDIQLLARNDQPKILCDLCDKPASQICTRCFYKGKGLLCEAHAETHECGEEMFLPVVNSPRVGVCGYTGGGYEGGYKEG